MRAWLKGPLGRVLARREAWLPKKSASFAIKHSKHRTDAPAVPLERVFELFFALVRDKTIDAAEWIDRFGVSRRNFQRYLLKLRTIGADHGFTITNIQNGRVFFEERNPGIRKLNERRRRELATLGRIASAMRGPVESEIRSATGDLPAGDDSGFLYLREATPAQSECVSDAYRELKSAAASHARVTFDYTARGVRSHRRAEPYHVVARSGRYYLVAYDLTRSGWRYFALDAIGGRLRRDGTFTPRAVPAKYLAKRSVGWLTGGSASSSSREATIRFSPVVAAAMISRTWQEGQLVEKFSDGSAQITLQFDDLAEAVRWTLSLAPDAAIIAPPEAVALARKTVAALEGLYAQMPQPANGIRRLSAVGKEIA